MRRALVACVMLAGACQPAENIAEEAEAPPVPMTAPELTSTVPAAASTAEPASSTTTTTEVIAVTTTLPILCVELPHPEHHDPCPPASTVVVRQQSPTQTSSPAPATSGWSIPTYIVMCESGGRWDAYNPSGASGPYQLMPMHFDGELAMNQSRAAQHAKAAQLWDGGNGKSHWSACL